MNCVARRHDATFHEGAPRTLVQRGVVASWNVSP